LLERVLDELKNALPHFEVRREQYEMMKNVSDAMNYGLKSAVHAPTGTGKSFGYLIPFLAMKLVKQDYRITISTYTINLQQQLIKDLQLINQIYSKIKPLEKPLTYTILKGRSNYFCRKRFLENQDDLPVSFSEKVNDKLVSLKSLNQALDRQNMGFKMTSSQWELLTVESCKKTDCPFFADCSYFHDYFESESDVVITNHALYFNRELFVKDAWSDFSFHIFDESHKLEKVVLDTSTFDLSINKIEGWAKQGISVGYKHGFESAKINAWSSKYLFKHPTVMKFKAGLQAIDKRLESNDSSLAKLRFNERTIHTMIQELYDWQREMFHEFHETVPSDEKKENELYKEDRNNWGIGFGELHEFKSIFELEEEKRVPWVERNDFGDILLKVTPTSIIHLPPLFKNGVLFTSGTLAQNDSNKEFAARLNVELDIDNVLSTPFSLAEQTIVYASKNVNPRNADYEEQLEKEITELLLNGDLKTFVLFTSTQLMERMYNKLKNTLILHAKEQGFVLKVWLQERNNHIEIMNSFRNKNDKSVLFGTLSYFEGIDLQGESLTQIILTRLPFSVPTHPVQEILDRNQQYSKWEALIRFEQAFGRLIRTRSDYGSFNILDSRIYENQNTDFLQLFKKDSIEITDEHDKIKEFHKKRN